MPPHPSLRYPSAATYSSEVGGIPLAGCGPVAWRFPEIAGRLGPSAKPPVLSQNVFVGQIVRLAQILSNFFKCRIQECQSVQSLHCLLVEVVDFGVCFCICFVGLAGTAFLAVQKLVHSPDLEEFAPPSQA